MTSIPRSSLDSLRAPIAMSSGGDSQRSRRRASAGEEEKEEAASSARSRKKARHSRGASTSSDVESVYHPQSDATRAAYNKLLSSLTLEMGDNPESDDALIQCAQKILEVLKSKNLASDDKAKKAAIQRILGQTRLSSERFKQLVNFGMKITDFRSKQEGEEEPAEEVITLEESRLASREQAQRCLEEMEASLFFHTPSQPCPRPPELIGQFGDVVGATAYAYGLFRMWKTKRIRCGEPWKKRESEEFELSAADAAELPAALEELKKRQARAGLEGDATLSVVIRAAEAMLQSHLAKSAN